MHRGAGDRARIELCDREAAGAGVRVGQTLAAARARAHRLRSVAVDDSLLRRAGREAVERLLGLSPRIHASSSTRFWVEPARDLPAFAARAVATLARFGSVAVGVGPDATVAHAAAASLDDGFRIVPPGSARAFLDDCPLEVLEIPSDALDVLRALGVRSVAQLRALDPVSLGMRFGPAVAAARRRADGHDPRGPLTPRPRPDLEVSLDLDHEIDHHEPLLFLLAPALRELATTLRAQGRGAVTTRLELRCARGPATALVARTAAPLADGRALLDLLRTRLERVTLEAPVTGLRVRAEETAELREAPAGLFGDGPGRDPAARDVALARLRGRLGDDAVRRASRVEVGPPLGRAAWTEDTPARGLALPWCRLDPPARVVRGRVRVGGRVRLLRRIGRVERVTPPWWEDGRKVVQLSAWAELDGPMLVLLRARCGTDCDDRWEVVAWVD